jgi:hypothetical protein
MTRVFAISAKAILPVVSLLAAALLVTTAASAQEAESAPAPAAAAKPKPPAKPAKPKPVAAKKKPAAAEAKTESKTESKAEAKPETKPAAKPAARPKPAATHAAVNHNEPSLLGQYGDWGAYTATPGGKKVCFALSKPKSTKASKDDVKRDPAYVFIATRPSDKVKDEVSVIIGYPLSTKTDTVAAVGTTSFAMLTQNDGAWIKNAAEEPQLIEAMRKGADLVIKGASSRGTQTTDTYSLKGIASALDRVAKECGGHG